MIGRLLAWLLRILGGGQQRAADAAADARVIAAERDAPQDSVAQAERDAARGKF